uniref:Uncharacterized protein n=1 Tax=Opuntia streptacantha TaxID=393608 RepID=A0A7C9ALQ6_OPUST
MVIEYSRWHWWQNHILKLIPCNCQKIISKRPIEKVPSYVASYPKPNYTTINPNYKLKKEDFGHNATLLQISRNYSTKTPALKPRKKTHLQISKSQVSTQ